MPNNDTPSAGSQEGEGPVKNPDEIAKLPNNSRNPAETNAPSETARQDLVRRTPRRRANSFPYPRRVQTDVQGWEPHAGREPPLHQMGTTFGSAFPLAHHPSNRIAQAVAPLYSPADRAPLPPYPPFLPHSGPVYPEANQSLFPYYLPGAPFEDHTPNQDNPWLAFIPGPLHQELTPSTTTSQYSTPCLAVEPKKKKLMCEICGRTFTKASSVTAHMIIHTGERKWVCPKCKRVFGKEYNLKRHLQTVCSDE